MGEEEIALVHYDGAEVYLRVEVRGLTRRFLYSVDGIDWTEVNTLENCIYLCDEGVPNDRKRHTGTLVGIFALSDESDNNSYADFEYFRYEDR